VVSEFAFADGVAGPRKQPTQGRAKDTVAAILEATFQVLDDAGADGLTTTRVAEVAGVSVGTLYQYFPNRDALITALLADHLGSAIAAVERECAAQVAAGAPLAVAIERVVRVFLHDKAERADNARILNKAFGPAMLDDRPLVRAAAERAHRAVASVLAVHEPAEAALARARLGCDALEGMIRGALAAPETLGDPAWVDQVVRITLAGLAGVG
jgi:AcrR family transcriptional regulator